VRCEYRDTTGGQCRRLSGRVRAGPPFALCSNHWRNLSQEAVARIPKSKPIYVSKEGRALERAIARRKRSVARAKALAGATRL
jgi:hypothetical protein